MVVQSRIVARFSLFLSSLFLTNAIAAPNVIEIPASPPATEAPLQRFFVEIDGESIVSRNQKIRASGSTKLDITTYRNDLFKKRQEIRGQMKVDKIVREMDLLLHGFVVEGTDDQIADIQKISGVTKISRVGRVYVPETELPRDIRTLTNRTPILPPLDVNRIWEEFGVTGKGKVISIIDTGVDYNHPDLGGCFGPGCKVVAGYDFVNNDQDPFDDNKHGTHVAGIAAGNGTMKGVAPDATIHAYKVLSKAGSGTEDDIIQAIERSIDPNGDGDDSDAVDVINMSLGGSSDSASPIARAVNYASWASVVVCAAGNSGSTSPIGAPAAARESIAVAASENVTKLAKFTSFGPTSDFALKPDITAPGVNIQSTLPGGMYGALSGTSMASPFIAGLSILLLEKNQLSHGMSAVSIIKSRLAVTSKSLLEGATSINAFAKQGQGLVQPFAALESRFEIFQLRANQEVNSEEGSDLRVHNIGDEYLTRRAVIDLSGKVPAGKTYRVELDHNLGEGADIRVNKSKIDSSNIKEPIIVFIRQKTSSIPKTNEYPNGNGIMVKLIDDSNGSSLMVPVSVFLRHPLNLRLVRKEKLFNSIRIVDEAEISSSTIKINYGKLLYFDLATGNSPIFQETIWLMPSKYGLFATSTSREPGKTFKNLWFDQIDLQGSMIRSLTKESLVNSTSTQFESVNGGTAQPGQYWSLAVWRSKKLSFPDFVDSRDILRFSPIPSEWAYIINHTWTENDINHLVVEPIVGMGLDHIAVLPTNGYQLTQFHPVMQNGQWPAYSCNKHSLSLKDMTISFGSRPYLGGSSIAVGKSETLPILTWTAKHVPSISPTPGNFCDNVSDFFSLEVGFNSTGEATMVENFQPIHQFYKYVSPQKIGIGPKWPVGPLFAVAGSGLEGVLAGTVMRMGENRLTPFVYSIAKIEGEVVKSGNARLSELSEKIPLSIGKYVLQMADSKTSPNVEYVANFEILEPTQIAANNLKYLPTLKFFFFEQKEGRINMTLVGNGMQNSVETSMIVMLRKDDSDSWENIPLTFSNNGTFHGSFIPIDDLSKYQMKVHSL
ncbi:MAG: S8 family serine peptidase [Proteobacteria bacterium]|nr:S8 family serine peptidase [Pseudomonadota bacterium]